MQENYFLSCPSLNKAGWKLIQSSSLQVVVYFIGLTLCQLKNKDFIKQAYLHSDIAQSIVVENNSCWATWHVTRALQQLTQNFKLFLLMGIILVWNFFCICWNKIKFILTSCHYKVHWFMQVIAYSPKFINLCLIMYITHSSFRALKNALWCVLHVWRNIWIFELVPSNSLWNEHSNGILFA